ncbi:hypothetical protein EYF80_001099 [Liparis tanakae]|uniref:Uncharacterized protein n=1 Tax=Liparis tanakae TaxID=230148 RepID=A0A4Z2JFL0_9TELE|nr:hypothetical protein EYF80_001099 [Liparis tanakae]
MWCHKGGTWSRQMLLDRASLKTTIQTASKIKFLNHVSQSKTKTKKERCYVSCPPLLASDNTVRHSSLLIQEPQQDRAQEADIKCSNGRHWKGYHTYDAAHGSKALD